jgi:hypothetical protein
LLILISKLLAKNGGLYDFPYPEVAQSLNNGLQENRVPVLLLDFPKQSVKKSKWDVILRYLKRKEDFNPSLTAIDVPYYIAPTTIQNVIDLRSPDVREWFLGTV